MTQSKELICPLKKKSLFFRKFFHSYSELGKGWEILQESLHLFMVKSMVSGELSLLIPIENCDKNVDLPIKNGDFPVPVPSFTH